MPELTWIGKDAVVGHHAQVPFRLLEEVPDLSCPAPDGNTENLIVQGDNLEALKALLPRYAGQVKCVYIDPPYNTGNEGWVYNDAVNSPEIRQWLGQTVGKEAEDLSRHDKWLCLMYPRLVLLRQFLRDDGAIFVSIDDNEVASLRLVMDEVFGKQSFAATFVWEKRTTRENRRVFSFNHDFILCYSKRREEFEGTRGELPLPEEVKRRYSNPDNDPRGSWQSVSLNAQAGHGTPSQFYALTTPAGRKLDPPKGRCWAVTKERLAELLADNRLWFGANGRCVPRLKKFLSETERGLTPHTLWAAEEVGTTDSAKKDVLSMLGDTMHFETPKPIELIQRVLQIASDRDSLILDSFAGSGTTGYAVLALNKQDGGNRRFILVELEEKIAREITAERVRRVARGYTNAKGEAVPGLGGGFQFARLGKPLFDESGAIRTDVTFPELAEFVFFKETGRPLPRRGTSILPVKAPRHGQDGRATPSPLLGVHEGRAVYLLFNGVLGDKSVGGGNVLTGPVLAQLPPQAGPKVIYAAACRLGRARLEAERITFKQTPYDLQV